MSRFARFARGSGGGDSSTLITILLLCCCSVLIVLGIYGTAEASDSNKTGIETLQDLFEGKTPIEDLISNLEKGGDTSVPCQGSWSDWGACTATCGGGTRNRTWTTTAEPLYGGTACPSPLTQEEACNTDACPAEPCEGSWSSWSGCSATCGGGIKTKTWTTTKEPKYGGTACPSPLTQEEACNTQVCPIDCVGDWEFPNGSCNRSCGDYIDSYQYVITTEAAHGGAACPHAAGDIEQRSCPYTACPTVDTTETIDGVTYDVKYYDITDGHVGYYVQRDGPYWHSPTKTYWNGELKTSADFGTGTEPDPIKGSDGHGYLKGTEQSTQGNYTRYSVKRSQQPIPQQGTCVLDEAVESDMNNKGYTDYECELICGRQASEGTCESYQKTCDYQASGGVRIRATLAGACKWDEGGSDDSSSLAAAQPTEITPVWQNKSNKNIYGGTFIKSIDEGSLGPCKDECFEDKDCTGFSYKHFGKKCYLHSGDIDFIPDFSLSRSSFKILRQYE